MIQSSKKINNLFLAQTFFTQTKLLRIEPTRSLRIFRAFANMFYQICGYSLKIRKKEIKSIKIKKGVVFAIVGKLCICILQAGKLQQLCPPGYDFVFLFFVFPYLIFCILYFHIFVDVGNSASVFCKLENCSNFAHLAMILYFFF